MGIVQVRITQNRLNLDKKGDMMNETLIEKMNSIKNELLKETSTDPIEIVRKVMQQDFVAIHGPEHHFLDGAAFLVAYNNAGGQINLEKSLIELSKRALTMPGAMCGYWGICGSVASLGAALAIIHQTGPLSDSSYYADHMEYSSITLHKMSIIGGPRCCKRNAFIALTSAVNYVNEKYGVQMRCQIDRCEFSVRNQQCIKERCPFYRKNSFNESIASELTENQ